MHKESRSRPVGQLRLSIYLCALDVRYLQIFLATLVVPSV